jgi:hypothetical protein
VLQTVEEVAEDWRSDDIKGLLGRCNFKSDMLDRKVSLLSGGEKVISRFMFSFPVDIQLAFVNDRRNSNSCLFL